MCGLFGWVAARALGNREFDQALDRLAHRGPDGRGRWQGRTQDGLHIGLGHTRLAIIDAEGGAQPFWSHDRRFVVSFNGEIYNYVELRETLRSRGCRFTTQSDTEVLVEAYRVWGADCLTRLRGMFAFALYDTAYGRLVLARDPFGKKPLFLADMTDGVAFASELAPLLNLPGVTRRLNEAVLSEYLLRRYVPGPQTFFQGVRKLPPGCFAVHEGGRFIEHRYFTPPLVTTQPKTVSPAYAVAAFRTGLEEAVRLRLRSDAPYGVYLSGGIDSSAIAALMARQVDVVRSFAVGFEEAAYSELPYAAAVATRLGARHESLTVTAEDFARHWPAAVRYRGAPVSEASDIPIFMLSHAANASVKMVLTGEGADELLAGYPKHRAERWVCAYHRIVSAGMHGCLLDPLIQRRGSRRLGILSRALCEGDPQERAALWFASGSREDVEALSSRRVCSAEASQSLPSSLRQVMLADQTHWLPDNLLERADRMMMAAGVEGRAPFMDIELATLVAGFPDHLLFDRRGGKAILRAAAKDLLDDTTLHRRKVGFRTPVGDWFRGPLKPMLTDLLGDPQSGVRHLLNGAVIDRMLAAHLGGLRDETDMLWTVANLELFLREYQPDMDA